MLRYIFLVALFSTGCAIQPYPNPSDDCPELPAGVVVSPKVELKIAEFIGFVIGGGDITTYEGMEKIPADYSTKIYAIRQICLQSKVAGLGGTDIPSITDLLLKYLLGEVQPPPPAWVRGRADKNHCTGNELVAFKDVIVNGKNTDERAKACMNMCATAEKSGAQCCWFSDYAGDASHPQSDSQCSAWTGPVKPGCTFCGGNISYAIWNDAK